MSTKLFDYLCLVLVIAGAINWGLVGVFQFNLVEFICGGFNMISRIIYGVIAIAGIYTLSFFGRIGDCSKME
ncbi:MAG: DUF378 domain-containing protein [Lachnospira sp.]|nr:DUF378 domain-containing protein [Lachnospira sp.]